MKLKLQVNVKVNETPGVRQILMFISHYLKLFSWFNHIFFTFYLLKECKKIPKSCVKNEMVWKKTMICTVQGDKDIETTVW